MGGTENKPVLLITGDVVDDGEENQFTKARKILDPLYLEIFIYSRFQVIMIMDVMEFMQRRADLNF